MPTRRWLACIVLFPIVAGAATVVNTDVTHTDERYSVAFDVRIDADSAEVRRHLTDYAHYTRLSDSIIESRVVRIYSPTRVRVAGRLDPCVMIFCKTVNIARDIEELDEGPTTTTTRRDSATSTTDGTTTTAPGP